MKILKVLLIFFIAILCVGLIACSIYFQGYKQIETGDDYESVKNILFLINQPQSCVWAKGYGESQVQSIFQLHHYETTVILLRFRDKDDIRFFKEYELSKQRFIEEVEGKKKEYGRLLDKMNPNLLEKDWERVYMEGYFQGYGTDYSYDIYLRENEVLIIAESNVG